MKRTFPLFLCLLVTLTGCHSVGDKSMSITTIYTATVILSLGVLGVYLATIRQKNPWYLLLFSAIPVVNIAYQWLSTCTSLDAALWANRLSYLGSVFLPLSMFMIVLNSAKLSYKRWIPWILIGVAVGIFLIAGSPGFSTLYYKEVTLETVNGATILDKSYGILHPLYFVYLLAYFTAMITAILYATLKKTVRSNAHAVILAGAVLVNIGVWLIGQLTDIEFEFLSISYIISELFLLGLQYLIQDAQQNDCIDQTESVYVSAEPVVANETIDLTALDQFRKGVEELTKTERKVYLMYVDGCSTKDVLEALEITQNTLKYHNKNIYSKLGVNSRKQLIELAKSENTMTE